MSRAGRWIVVLAALLAAAVLVAELAAGVTLFGAVVKSATTAGMLMAVVGLGQRLWAGATIAGAQLPGGVGIGLEQSDELAKLWRAVTRLRRSTDRRLKDLERRVLGENGDGGNIQ